MHNFHHATDFLLKSNDPARWLTKADSYCLQLRKHGAVQLQQDDEGIRPLIDAFGNDEVAFADYVESLERRLTGAKADGIRCLHVLLKARLAAR